MGRIIDKITSKYAVFVNMLVECILIGFNLVTIAFLKYNWSSYATCFMWGLHDGMLNTHTF